MSRLLCGIVGLAAGLSFASVSAADKPAQTIAGFGTVVDPDGDCRFADRVKMTIDVPNTVHDFTFRSEPGQSKSNSPRLFQDVKGDFQLAIKVARFRLRRRMLRRLADPAIAAPACSSGRTIAISFASSESVPGAAPIPSFTSSASTTVNRPRSGSSRLKTRTPTSA